MCATDSQTMLFFVKPQHFVRPPKNSQFPTKGINKWLNCNFIEFYVRVNGRISNKWWIRAASTKSMTVSRAHFVYLSFVHFYATTLFVACATPPQYINALAFAFTFASSDCDGAAFRSIHSINCFVFRFGLFVTFLNWLWRPLNNALNDEIENKRNYRNNNNNKCQCVLCFCSLFVINCSNKIYVCWIWSVIGLPIHLYVDYFAGTLRNTDVVRFAPACRCLSNYSICPLRGKIQSFYVRVLYDYYYFRSVNE